MACPHVTPVSSELRQRAAEELERLPPESALATLMLDYVRLRAASRACANEAPR